MSSIGAIERLTQQRVVRLFVDRLGYAYDGDSRHRSNTNIDEAALELWLREYQGWAEHPDGDVLVRRAVAALVKEAGHATGALYDSNKAVYHRLRSGVQVKADVGQHNTTVKLIDWDHPERNRFTIAEEVTVTGRSGRGSTKRPDIVLSVNGIAVAVLELKRSSVGVTEGIRQQWDSQKPEFIEHFFSTIQLVLAGNDSQGVRYATTLTPEKYWLTWKEPAPDPAPDPPLGRLDADLIALCSKERLLELIHDFVVFDNGTKKLCRHNQYFGVRAAQPFVRRRQGGIIWHTQGSGKSLTMVWLARWIRENIDDSRILIVTDRKELDEQIEGVFVGVGEKYVHRTRSGHDLLKVLGGAEASIICSLIHKFGGSDGDGQEGVSDKDVRAFVSELLRMKPGDFTPRGEVFVFVDECHRTQTGLMHKAMKTILPNATFIGFTGTPLLKTDKETTVQTFGDWIHRYKFDEAVADGVVLDLRYEARDVDQQLTSAARVDEWFEVKTRGLTPLARAQLKARWGTMQTMLTSRGRLERIGGDILLDMEKLDRLASGRGNAMLVAGSIYEACKYYEFFRTTDLVGKCAIVTSYTPAQATIKGEDPGEGETDALKKYAVYRQMLADWFNEPADDAVKRVETFEQQVKERFIKEPARMKLLIVVDKLLTGFDAPPATVLYIDRKMQDHGLFQAICRVNRLDGDDKEFGLIVDYKDLFRHIEGALKDYTGGALAGYDPADVNGLLKDPFVEGRRRLDELFDQLESLCAAVEPPRDDAAHYRYFSSADPGNIAQLSANEPRRLQLYTLVAALVRAYAVVANDMARGGYSPAQAVRVQQHVQHYEQLRQQVKLHSGDAIDLKAYEPTMRQLIDWYIRAEESVKVSAFEDLSLVQLVARQGASAVDALPAALRRGQAAAETIENNVRRAIVNLSPLNPKYYDRMSELLDALIEQRRQDALDYKEYLAALADVARQVQTGPAAGGYPTALVRPAQRALYDNLGGDETLALQVDDTVRQNLQDGWRDNVMKTRRVERAIRAILGEGDERVGSTLDLVKRQDDY
jgi:type I restriction enzyme R subunit